MLPGLPPLQAGQKESSEVVQSTPLMHLNLWQFLRICSTALVEQCLLLAMGIQPNRM